MATQVLQWMAIPYDVMEEDGSLRLAVAVCVTPRLQDATTAPNTLNQYPDFLNWPNTLTKISIALDIDGKIIKPDELRRIDEAPSEEVWKSVFKPTTMVRPFEYKPFVDAQIFSFPVKNVQQKLLTLYSSFAKDYSFDQPELQEEKLESSFTKVQVNQNPINQKIGAILNEFMPDEKGETVSSQMRNRWELEAERYANERGEEKNEVRPIKREQVKIPSASSLLVALDLGSSPAKDMLMAELYHAPRNVARSGVVNGKKVRRVGRNAVEVPKFDFHQVVSVMREYPIMLRNLGIVQHFTFKLPESMGTEGKIRCRVKWETPQLPGTTNETPWVAWHLLKDGNRQYWQFLPKPEPESDIKGPVLCLSDSKLFDVVQVDVDSASLKTLGYVRNIKHRASKTRGTRDFKNNVTPPSVRGTGLQLVKHNRAISLARSIVRNAKNWNNLVANNEIVLYADDVVRGYRLDIFDETANSWQSLMRRNANYKFPEASGNLKTVGISVTDEEGVLTLGATRPAGRAPSAQRDLYAHETIAQWEGWSLVVPPIGQHIGKEDELAPAQSSSKPPADFEYQVESSSTIVARSLPRLRFGRKYRIRARIADAAGNGPRFDQLNPTDVSCATELIRFLRWDPVVSPTLALRNHPVEGESLEKMVIRNYNDSLDDATEVPTTEISYRHLLPPLASQQLAERHGKFDESPTGQMKGNNATYSMIAGKLGDVPSRYYTKNAAGNLVPEAANNTPPADPQKAANAIRYPLLESGATAVPYLADPIARGFTISKVPGIPSGKFMEVGLLGVNMGTISSAYGVASVVFNDEVSWPEIQSVLIAFAEGTQTPAWDAGTRTLTIYLPKGEQATIIFSSTLGADQAEADNNLGLLGQRQALVNAGVVGAAMSAAARGLSWLVTPGRTLQLVHATQRPLKKPELKKAKVTVREFGGTNAEITVDELYVHAKTTQKVDVHTEWPMWEDNLAKPAPQLLQQRAPFYEQQVEDRADNTLKNVATQEFGDTKYRLVTYIPTATTLFREFMPQALRSDATKLSKVGTSKELKVLNTKRPDNVKLLYVIPSFTWSVEKPEWDGKMATRTRQGGGLRVYMERPWYSSGNDEKLGIVLYSKETFTPKKEGSNDKDGFGVMYKPGGFNAGIVDAYLGSQMGVSNNEGSKVNIPDTLIPYVTQWGLDPIWLSAPTPADAAPRIGNFVDPAVILSSVSIPEVNPQQRFSVVGFTPEYDTDRKLWRCDIQLDPGESYYPFVKFAFCRVQPNSLSNSQTGHDVYCSQVITSEFCQLAPNRVASVVLDEGDKSVTVQVIGHTYRINTTGQLGSEIEVTLEKRDTSKGGDELGWTPMLTQRIDRIPAANLWAGSIELPTGVTAEKYRVVIKEYEQLFSDPTDERERANSLGNKEKGDGPLDMSLAKRITYAEVFNLFA